MNCIGIESTAHTFSCSVVNDKGEILSEVREMYRSSDKGIIPNKCAEFLKSVIWLLFHKVLECPYLYGLELMLLNP